MRRCVPATGASSPDEFALQGCPLLDLKGVKCIPVISALANLLGTSSNAKTCWNRFINNPRNYSWTQLVFVLPGREVRYEFERDVVDCDGNVTWIAASDIMTVLPDLGRRVWEGYRTQSLWFSDKLDDVLFWQRPIGDYHSLTTGSRMMVYSILHAHKDHFYVPRRAPERPEPAEPGAALLPRPFVSAAALLREQQRYCATVFACALLFLALMLLVHA